VIGQADGILAGRFVGRPLFSCHQTISVQFIEFDDVGAWQGCLVREFVHAKMPIDLTYNKRSVTSHSVIRSEPRFRIMQPHS